MASAARPPGLGRPMTVSVTSCSVRSLASASRRNERPLRVDVGRRGGDQAPGHAGDLGPGSEQLGIDPHRHEAHARRVDAHVVVDVLDRVLAHDDDAGHLPGDPGLHLDEGVPAADADPLAPGRGVLHLQAPVDGDRVVERDDGRQEPLDGQQAVAEALVVVDEVEVLRPALQVLPGADAERQGLAEGPRRELEDLDHVAQVPDLPVGGEAAGVVVVEDVEAGELGQLHPLVEHGVGLAAEHVDVVPEVDEGLREVPGVDPLAADVGLPPVREVGDAQRIVRPRVHERGAYRRVTRRSEAVRSSSTSGRP